MLKRNDVFLGFEITDEWKKKNTGQPNQMNRKESGKK